MEPEETTQDEGIQDTTDPIDVGGDPDNGADTPDPEIP